MSSFIKIGPLVQKLQDDTQTAWLSPIPTAVLFEEETTLKRDGGRGY